MKDQPAVALSGMDDSQLVQEINHKNHQVEILHGEIKKYEDNLEKEKRKVSMLTMENQAYQHQICQLQQEPPPVLPHSPNYVSADHCLVCIIVLFCFLVW